MNYWDFEIYMYFYDFMWDLLSENLKFWHSANLSKVLGFYMGFKDLFRSLEYIWDFGIYFGLWDLMRDFEIHMGS